MERLLRTVPVVFCLPIYMFIYALYTDAVTNNVSFNDKMGDRKKTRKRSVWIATLRVEILSMLII